MAVRTKEEILNAVKTRLGDNADDESLSFLEDITDTLNDFESKAGADSGEDWKAKYEENDKTWREKYKARFFSSVPDDKDDNKDDNKDNETEKPKTFEDLFTQEG